MLAQRGLGTLQRSLRLGGICAGRFQALHGCGVVTHKATVALHVQGTAPLFGGGTARGSFSLQDGLLLLVDALARHLLAGLGSGQCRLCFGHAGPGLVEAGAVVAALQAHQHIAGLYWLVVCHRDLGHVAGHPWAQRHPVGTDVGVVGGLQIAAGGEPVAGEGQQRDGCQAAAGGVGQAATGSGFGPLFSFDWCGLFYGNIHVRFPFLKYDYCPTS